MASPMASSFRPPLEMLIESLLQEERIYLRQLDCLEQVIRLKLLGNELQQLERPIKTLIRLSTSLTTELNSNDNPCGKLHSRCLLEFSDSAKDAYESYMNSFTLSSGSIVPSALEQMKLDEILSSLQIDGVVENDLDWLLRRPLSRIRVYATSYKKLIHTAEDASEYFLAHQFFHNLMKHARDALSRAKEARNVLLAAARSVRSPTAMLHFSDDPTANGVMTPSAPNDMDELVALQRSVDTSRVRDIFTLSPVSYFLELLPKSDGPRRAIIARGMFHLHMCHFKSGEIVNCGVELVLLTDLLLILWSGPSDGSLMFPPLLRGVFKIDTALSEICTIALDLAGRQKISLKAQSEAQKIRWYSLLSASEISPSHTTTKLPLGVSVQGLHISTLKATSSISLPSPPPTSASSSFPVTAPLSIIREDSLLSISGQMRTPDTLEEQPFYFDVDEDKTPTCGDLTPKPTSTDKDLQSRSTVSRYEGMLTSNQQVPSTPEYFQKDYFPSFGNEENIPRKTTPSAFPAPPQRTPKGSSVLGHAKAQNVLVNVPRSSHQSRTFSQHLESAFTIRGTSVATKNSQSTQTDTTKFYPPQLPAFDFAAQDDVSARDSEFATYSSSQLSHFGVPSRKIDAPTPIAAASNEASRLLTDHACQVPGSLAKRRLGSAMSLSSLKSPRTRRYSGGDEIIGIMAECFSWETGHWTPILIDDMDDAHGKIKTVRSCVVSIYTSSDPQGRVEIYDVKESRTVVSLKIFRESSVIRDDPFDVSVGFQVGQSRAYYMFRCQNPEQADIFENSINQVKTDTPGPQCIAYGNSSALSVAALRDEDDMDAYTLMFNGKVKLYRLDTGKWVATGSARATIKVKLGTKDTRFIVIGKTKKGEKLLLIDTITNPRDCEAVSKSAISLKTRIRGANALTGSVWLLQFKNEKERMRILSIAC